MTKFLRYLLPATLIAVFVGLATDKLARPGFSDAEVNFVPAALRVLGQCDVEAAVSLAWGCLPIMQWPSYVGAVKAWLHAPLFAAFGINEWTVRLPPVLMAAAALAIFWGFMRRELGGAWALVGLALMASDPLLISHARLDWGPAMFATLMRALALVALWYWLHLGQTRWLLLLCLAFLAGFLDKLIFAWVIVAFAGAALLVSGKTVFDRLRAGSPWQPLIAATTLLLLAWGGATLVRGAVAAEHLFALDPDAIDPIGKLAKVWALYATTFSGTSVMRRVFGIVAPATAAFNILALVQISLAVFLLARWRPWTPARRLLAFLTVAMVLLFCVILATPHVAGTHHLIMLWPLPTLQLITLLAIVSQRHGTIPGRHGPGQRATVATIGAVVCGAQLAWHIGIDLRYDDLWRNDNDYRVEFDPAVGKLAQRLAKIDAHQVISLDRGLHQPLIAYSPRSRAAAFHEMSNPTADATAALDAPAGKRLAFVLFAPSSAPATDARARLDALAAKHRLCVRDEAEVAGAGGRPAYLIVVAEAGENCPLPRPPN